MHNIGEHQTHLTQSRRCRLAFEVDYDGEYDASIIIYPNLCIVPAINIVQAIKIAQAKKYRPSEKYRPRPSDKDCPSDRPKERLS